MLSSLLNKNTRKAVAKKAAPAPKTAQASIPYKECYENGVFQVSEGVFSKTYAFSDSTFKTLDERNQFPIYERYQAFLNMLTPPEQLFIHFVNTPEDPEERLKQITPQPQNDGLNSYRTERTKILQSSLQSARKNIATTKYLTFTTENNSVEAAMSRFQDIDGIVKKDFEAITPLTKTKALTLDERLELLYKIIHSDEENYLFEHDAEGNVSVNWKSMRKQGLTTKDLLAAPLKFNASNFQIGDRYGQSLFMHNIANWLNTNFISALSELSFESVISMQIVPVPQDEALKEIHNSSVGITSEVIEAQKNAIKNNYSPEFISMDLKNAKKQIDELQEDMMNRDQRLFKFSLTLTHFAENPGLLKEQLDQIKAIASKFLCTIMPLSMQQERGFASALPLGINTTQTRRPLTTESLGIFVPFNEITCFDKGGYYYGTNQVNKTAIVYNRKLGQNYNGLYLGASGSGKSFGGKTEITDTILSTDDYVYVIDPDGEYAPLAEAYGGTVIKIAPGNGVYLNPMDLNIDTTHDSDGDPISMKSDFVCGLLETMLGSRMELTPVQKSIVNRCVIQMYRNYLEHLQALPPDANGKKKTIDRAYCPTLETLYDLLLQQPQAEAKHLAIVMESYTTGSFNTFAHKTNVDLDKRFIVYDIRDIGNNLRDLGLRICLSDIWNKMIENRAKAKWTWAYVDEFHLLLSNESSSEFVKSIWKRARKFWGLPTGLTQNVEDLLLSPAARAIINNTNFIELLNQSPLDRANLAELLSLSDNDLKFITNANAGSGLIYTGKYTIPFVNDFPKDSNIYHVLSTKGDEKNAQEESNTTEGVVTESASQKYA